MILVYIVECIQDPLDQAGRQAAEWFLRPRAEKEDVWVHVSEPKTKADVCTLLNEAYHEAKKYGEPCPPIVFHIDAHGNEEGIGMPDGALLPWAELKGYLQQLSRISNLQVILLVGACKGAYGIRMLNMNEAAPYFCILGSHLNIDNRRLMEFYRDFYTELLTHKRLDIFVPTLLPKYKDCMNFDTAHSMFKGVYKGYLGRENRLKLIQMRNRTFKKLTKARLPEEAKKTSFFLLKHPEIMERQMFDKFRRAFFMLDKYPENEQRFSHITYESILKEIQEEEGE